MHPLEPYLPDVRLDANYQAIKASVYPWPGEREPEHAGWDASTDVQRD